MLAGRQPQEREGLVVEPVEIRHRFVSGLVLLLLLLSVVVVAARNININRTLEKIQVVGGVPDLRSAKISNVRIEEILGLNSRADEGGIIRASRARHTKI